MIIILEKNANLKKYSIFISISFNTKKNCIRLLNMPAYTHKYYIKVPNELLFVM